MPVNTGLASISNDLLLVGVAIYAVAMVAYAFDFAFGKQKTVTAPAPAVKVRELVGAAAAAGDQATGALPAQGPAGGELAGDVQAPARAAGALPASGGPGTPRSRRPSGAWLTGAVLLTGAGFAAHLAGVITRGLAVHRLPWGDMYEFVIALTCVAVAFSLAVMIRYRAYYIGLFVMAAVVVVFGLAETVIYTPAGPLVPALQSYWLAIHVTAMTLATGVFFIAAVIGITYFFVDRYARQVAAGRPSGADGILRRLPGPEVLDRLAYRTVVFGFPIWTFGVIAGAIWADRAWGSYWSWDPTETWAFITWIVYACFLHARATAGWRGRRAAVIQLLGFACLLFNVGVVSLLIPGLHSYSGLPH